MPPGGTTGGGVAFSNAYNGTAVRGYTVIPVLPGFRLVGRTAAYDPGWAFDNTAFGTGTVDVGSSVSISSGAFFAWAFSVPQVRQSQRAGYFLPR